MNMYYADSNILSILLALITMAAGIYSASSKRKKGEEDIAHQQSLEQDLAQERAEAEAILSAQEKEELIEEAVPTTGTQILEPVEESVQEPVGQQKSNDVKSRLKSSPKDAVLFAEILKPKYKEF